MAPSFKISFPLPIRRPSSSPQSTPGSHLSPQSDYDDSPLCRPSLKAEELLGASTPDANVSGRSQTKRERKHLRKFPSFMSVTLADIDGDSPNRESTGMHAAGLQSPKQSSPRFVHGLSRHGSSPLLGLVGENQTTVTAEVDYFTSNGNQPRETESSSKLRSHYDKSKTPLLVSQQTSESSVRDMALRKGSPPILSSVRSNSVAVEPSDNFKPGNIHSRNFPKESGQSNESKNRLGDQVAIPPRRRPSVMDRPTLYPDAPQLFHAVSPPPALINSTLPRPIQSGNPQFVLTGKSRWWNKRKTKNQAFEDVRASIPQILSDDQSPLKVNIKKPKAGARNWFDSIETDDDALENMSINDPYSKFLLPEVETPAEIQQTSPGTALSLDESIAQMVPSTPSTHRKSSLSSKSRRSGPSDRKLSFKLDSPPLIASRTRLSGQYSFPRSAPSSPGLSRDLRPKDNESGIPMGLDLQNKSVLSLSSSDDEEGYSAPEIGHRGHRIRASVERAEYNSEVSLGNALRAQTVKPRHVVNRNSRRTSSRKSNASDIPPVPQIPARPQLSQRSSSMRWKEMVEEKERAQSIGTTTEAEAGDETIDSGASSLTDVPSTTTCQRPSSVNIKNRYSSSHRGSKLMKVTTEEEKLLEAMREKRASIRANDFQKGFSSAMQQLLASDLISRPRTAGVDGPPSRSSYYAVTSASAATRSSRGSMSPPLLQPTVFNPSGGKHHVYQASLGASSRLSASADDLTIEDSYPFPHVPSKPLPIHRQHPSHQQDDHDLPMTAHASNTLPIQSPIPTSSASAPTSAPSAIARMDAASSPSLSASASFSPSDALPSTPSTRNSPLTPPPAAAMTFYSVNRPSNITMPGVGLSPPPQAVRSSGSGTASAHGSIDLTGSGLAVTKGQLAHIDEAGTFSGGEQAKGFIVRNGLTMPTHMQLHSKAHGHGHERQHTSSSSVVVLDGMESYAARVDEENDITGWAMERW